MSDNTILTPEEAIAFIQNEVFTKENFEKKINHRLHFYKINKDSLTNLKTGGLCDPKGLEELTSKAYTKDSWVKGTVPFNNVTKKDIWGYFSDACMMVLSDIAYNVRYHLDREAPYALWGYTDFRLCFKNSKYSAHLCYKTVCDICLYPPKKQEKIDICKPLCITICTDNELVQ